MIIKELNKNELKEAHEIYCQCFDKEYQELSLPITGKLLGLYLNEKLIGITQIDIINNILENKKIALINSFCIKKEYQNKGYGDQFLKGCITILKDNKIDIINMTSNKNRIYAHKLYNKNNFETVETILFKKEL